MSEEKKYTLKELQDKYTGDLYGLTDKYVNNFKKSSYAYGTKDYMHLNNLVHENIRELVSLTSLKYEKICLFAHCFRENIDLLNGVMHESSRDHLYFIESENAIKIGRSIDVKRRYSSLQIDNPEALSINFIKYSSGMYEFAIQRMFSYLNIRGEWFKKHNDIYEYIERLKIQPNEKADNYSPFIDLRSSVLMNDF